MAGWSSHPGWECGGWERRLCHESGVNISLGPFWQQLCGNFVHSCPELSISRRGWHLVSMVQWSGFIEAISRAMLVVLEWRLAPPSRKILREISRCGAASLFRRHRVLIEGKRSTYFGPKFLSIFSPTLKSHSTRPNNIGYALVCNYMLFLELKKEMWWLWFLKNHKLDQKNRSKLVNLFSYLISSCHWPHNSVLYIWIESNAID